MSPKICQTRSSVSQNGLTITHLSGHFAIPTNESDKFRQWLFRHGAAHVFTAAASITPPQSPHSPLTTTASLHTVPAALLQLQHRAIATNHRFWLVKRVRPTDFGTSSATARLSFTLPVAAVTVDTGRT